MKEAIEVFWNRCMSYEGATEACLRTLWGVNRSALSRLALFLCFPSFKNFTCLSHWQTSLSICWNINSILEKLLLERDFVAPRAERTLWRLQEGSLNWLGLLNDGAVSTILTILHWNWIVLLVKLLQQRVIRIIKLRAQLEVIEIGWRNHLTEAKRILIRDCWDERRLQKRILRIDKMILFIYCIFNWWTVYYFIYGHMRRIWTTGKLSFTLFRKALWRIELITASLRTFHRRLCRWRIELCNSIILSISMIILKLCDFGCLWFRIRLCIFICWIYCSLLHLKVSDWALIESRRLSFLNQE